ncbi:hypothetical protein GCM10023328_30070 [Modestobacter marinus]|uniref:DUF4352 domain-containing protein n=1 Tax=Modestobacter marinus TaxID=477641 RepID=A0A846LH57_9ACTN|nr:hypothetical protein [Modestobacter marinus]NIH65934.1 hypothetical protein [Modestobacter marinus]GGL68195.1 hypothetical protein GCM10011589_25730 [Modestobacter marinus]
MSAAAGQDGAPQGWRRRRGVVLAVAVVAVVALLVVLGSVVGGGGDDDGTTAAGGASTVTASPSASGTASATAQPAEGTDPGDPVPAPATSTSPDAAPVVADTLPEELTPVAFDVTVDVAGVTASVVRIESIDGQATGPGDVAGPAVRVTVRIDNTTGELTSVDGVSVNVFSGPDRVPATPLGDPSQAPLSGNAPAGGSVEGVYVFSVPAAAQDDVTVQVGLRADAPRAVFSGAVR